MMQQLHRAGDVQKMLAKKHGVAHPEAHRIAGLVKQALAECNDALEKATAAQKADPAGWAAAQRARQRDEMMERSQQRMADLEARKEAARQEREEGAKAKLAKATAGGDVGAMLDEALEASERVDQVSDEHQKDSNFHAAMDRLRHAAEALGRIEAAGGAGSDAAELRGRFDETSAKIHARHAARVKAMLTGVKAPQNLYSGSDRDDWEKRVRVVWRKLRPADKILAVRFDQPSWGKERWSSTSEESLANDVTLVTKRYTTNEVLKVSVVVRTSDQIASIYQIPLRRDAAAGTSEVGVNTARGVRFVADMLLANFR